MSIYYTVFNEYIDVQIYAYSQILCMYSNSQCCARNIYASSGVLHSLLEMKKIWYTKVFFQPNYLADNCKFSKWSNHRHAHLITQFLKVKSVKCLHFTDNPNPSLEANITTSSGNGKGNNSSINITLKGNNSSINITCKGNNPSINITFRTNFLLRRIVLVYMYIVLNLMFLLLYNAFN